MKRINILLVCIVGFVSIHTGCSAAKSEKTGFLDDYSKLESYSDTSFRYVPDKSALAGYDTFIVDPVITFFHAKSEAGKKQKKGKLDEQDISDLKNYMHDAILKALSEDYNIAYQPGPGVARLRIALTDLKNSSTLQNILPATKLIGSGLGGASLEAELLDSQTGSQIGAIVESQLGSRLSLEGLSKWGDAKAVMDDWAKRLKQRLDESRK